MNLAARVGLGVLTTLAALLFVAFPALVAISAFWFFLTNEGVSMRVLPHVVVALLFGALPLAGFFAGWGFAMRRRRSRLNAYGLATAFGALGGLPTIAYVVIDTVLNAQGY